MQSSTIDRPRRSTLTSYKVLIGVVILCASMCASVLATETVRGEANMDERPDDMSSFVGHAVTFEREVVAAGPDGPLLGTLVVPDASEPIADGAPVVLIVPGSGPMDRDGNSPLGVAAATYRLLAEALAERGIASVRIDKRGMFGSSAAVPNANDVTIAAYGDDLLAWVETIRTELPQTVGSRCVIPLGHSEGGLVALAAMDRLPEPCGLILAAVPGRPLGDTLRAQLRANPANGPLIEEADEAITLLEQGQRVDETALHPALQSLFSASVQGFLIDAFAYDPNALARTLDVPTLVIGGGNDLQVPVADAQTLVEALANATLSVAWSSNHVLKSVPDGDPATNFAAYGDPEIPIDPEVVDAVAAFVQSLAP